METPNELLVRGIELQNEGKIDAAESVFRTLLDLDPDNGAALYSLGIITLNSGRTAEAFQIVEHGINCAPHFSPMWCIHALALQGLGRKDDALLSYDQALETDPKNILALLNSGALLRDMLRHHDALARSNRILEIDPDNQGALCNTGILLTEFRRSKEAVTMFKRLLQLNPDYEYAPGLLAYEQMHLCNWEDIAQLSQQIRQGISEGKRACKTLALMSLSDSAAEHFLAARIFARHKFPKQDIALWRGQKYQHERIRVAYISPDLREHPVGHLMAGIFEQHDKSRFETFAISLGSNDNSRLRSRIEKSFDHFIDAKHMTSLNIAKQMQEMEIDIAVDLAGYTADSRTDILTFRPAPVQANFLGYPGTLGLDYVDFIIADQYVIPPEHEVFYSEQVIRLPHNYLPTASGIEISPRTPTRSECGLPEHGFVFCSFSHDYKISPAIFDIWMRLLNRTPGSVLWLMSRNEDSRTNLRQAAEARGIDGSRIIFAERVPLVEDHLARYRQADIFLDTHPYNAHTTSADALMAGLPVITYMGNAFPARVAGSLLHAIGLPELATRSLRDYEMLAQELAAAPEKLRELKSKLVRNQGVFPLCNAEQFCRNLEVAYETMVSRYKQGKLPHTACMQG